jgi:hypothetical protein
MQQVNLSTVVSCYIHSQGIKAALEELKNCFEKINDKDAVSYFFNSGALARLRCTRYLAPCYELSRSLQGTRYRVKRPIDVS